MPEGLEEVGKTANCSIWYWVGQYTVWCGGISMGRLEGVGSKGFGKWVLRDLARRGNSLELLVDT